MSTEKRLLKIKKLTKNYGEPSIDPFDYKASLLHYLNYHNTNTSDKERREWAERYIKEKYPDTKIPNLHDREYRHLGSIARLIFLESYVEQHELDLVASEVQRILSTEETKEDVPDEDGPSRKEKLERSMDARASEFIGEFEGLVDEFITSGTNPNIQALINTMGVSGRASGRIVDYAKKKFDYYTAVLSDREALEYYSFSKPKIKKIAELYSILQEKLSQSKKIRKPRTRKEKPAGVLVQNMKYKFEDTELGIKSVSPTNIIGATEVLMYHARYRKLQYLKALDGQTLTVKGTTILNYDESKSFQKHVRKPETIKPVFGKGKLDTRRFVKDYKGDENSLSGRTSEDTIFIAAFK